MRDDNEISGFELGCGGLIIAGMVIIALTELILWIIK
jgi:hypothetical protein